MGTFVKAPATKNVRVGGSWYRAAPYWARPVALVHFGRLHVSSGSTQDIQPFKFTHQKVPQLGKS